MTPEERINLNTGLLLRHRKDIVKEFDLVSGTISDLARNPDILSRLPKKSLLQIDKKGNRIFIPFKGIKSVKLKNNFIIMEVGKTRKSK